MSRLILFILHGPWWLLLGLAALCGWLTLSMFGDLREEGAARLALRAAEPPPLVDVAAFDARQDAPVVELAVRAQLSPSHNTELVVKRNGIATSSDVLMVLVDPNAKAANEVARAAMIFPPERKDEVLAWIAARTVDLGALGRIVEIDGLVAQPGEASHAREAMEDQGLAQGEGLFFIEPFLDGRAAELKREPSLEILAVPGGAAAVLALLAAWRFLRRGTPRPTPATVTGSSGRPGPISASPPSPMAASPMRASVPGPSPRRPDTFNAGKAMAGGLLALIGGLALGQGLVAVLGGLVLILGLGRAVMQGAGALLRDATAPFLGAGAVASPVSSPTLPLAPPSLGPRRASQTASPASDPVIRAVPSTAEHLSGALARLKGSKVGVVVGAAILYVLLIQVFGAGGPLTFEEAGGPVVQSMASTAAPETEPRSSSDLP